MSSSEPPPAVEETVLAYYRAVADLEAPPETFRALVHPEVRITEHPNLITPRGAVRGAEESLAGLLAGRALLAEQRFDVHEVLVSGERAAVRATWVGVTAVDRGPLAAGTRLSAEVAAFLTVREGLVVAHETFDCYPPFGG